MVLNFNELKLFESGIRNIKEFAKQYKEADLYFHMDLDGVMSAIGMKKYLLNYGIEVKGFHVVQYGDKEWSAAKPKENRLAVLVDFANGKAVMHIHTDHHDGQIGVKKQTSTNFKHAMSNAGTISQEISPKELFPPEDIKLINIVDSADFSKNNITVEDVLRAAYNFDKKIGVEKNRTYMGLVVNKMLLAYKNKQGFLETVVKECQPSLVNMFTVIRKIATDNKYGIENIIKNSENYINSQSKDKKMVEISDYEDIRSLRSGQYVLMGNILIQYDGGNLFKGGYDRYTPFKNVPEAEYLIMGWSMGLIQVSKNPFKKGSNKFNLGEIAENILKRYKNKLSDIFITFGQIKAEYEKSIKSHDAFGFLVDDFFATFGKNIKVSKWGKDNKDIVNNIGNKKYKELTGEEKGILSNYAVTLYDIVLAQSGGHKDITNLSNLNFAYENTDKFIRKLMIDFAKELKDAKLE
jgi:hypothetical protein